MRTASESSPPPVSQKLRTYEYPQVGKETNDDLREAKREGLDIEKVLAVARREMANENEATRLEALRWIAALLERHRTQVRSILRTP